MANKRFSFRGLCRGRRCRKALGRDGKRKLKYIHAWVWLEWSTIQRYLFDGSELKDWPCQQGGGGERSVLRIEATRRSVWILGGKARSRFERSQPKHIVAEVHKRPHGLRRDLRRSRHVLSGPPRELAFHGDCNGLGVASGATTMSGASPIGGSADEGAGGGF